MPIPTPEQINAYETAPTHIAAAIEGLSEAQMHHLPGTGEWSIHEVVVHLGDSEATGTWRYSPGTDRTAQDVVRLSHVPMAFSGLKRPIVSTCRGEPCSRPEETQAQLLRWRHLWQEESPYVKRAAPTTVARHLC